MDRQTDGWNNQTDRWKSGRMDGRIDRLMNGWTCSRMDGQMDGLNEWTDGATNRRNERKNRLDGQTMGGQTDAKMDRNG